MNRIVLIFLYIFLAGCSEVCGNLVTSTNDLELLNGYSTFVTVDVTSPLEKEVTLNYTDSHEVKVSIVGDGTGPPWKILLEARSPGHDVISFSTTPNVTDVSNAFIRVTVMTSKALEMMSFVVGWIYFFAWSFGFYPQIYDNWKRKSVIGLNFDFVFLNLLGFSLYSLFNCALYWNPTVKAIYFEEHKKGLNPIEINDIFFALHGVCAILVTILQLYIYERGGQTVSLMAKCIIGICIIVVILTLILTLSTSIVNWLQFIMICSYVKLLTTLIKYIPQAFMNYKRKSTAGWNILNSMCDFTGGILSMMQMIVNSYNYDDWGSIFGDPTKFGLGLVSAIYDIIFFVQHYILYRRPSKKEMDLTGRI